jgi:hypothetical protein
MEFKPLEIVMIVLALAIPVGLLVILLIPGAGASAFAFAMDRNNMPYVFGGAAAAVTAVLAFRIYRRIRPRGPRKD